MLALCPQAACTNVTLLFSLLKVVFGAKRFSVDNQQVSNDILLVIRSNGEARLLNSAFVYT